MANARGFLKRQRKQSAAEGDGNASTSIDYVEVARVAYDLYEQRGREDGHALDDWLKAEAMVRNSV